jgi:hypothetical protein
VHVLVVRDTGTDRTRAHGGTRRTDTGAPQERSTRVALLRHEHSIAHPGIDGNGRG